MLARGEFLIDMTYKTYKSHKTYYLKAQGLLELVVALGVITVGVVGTVTLTTGSLASSTDTAARVVATNLAAEGIEVVRQIRDNNWLAGCPDPDRLASPYKWEKGGCFSWHTGLSGLIPTDSAIVILDSDTYGWSLDFGALKLTDDKTRLYVPRAGTGLWYQTAGTSGEETTNFSRLIKILKICEDDTVQEDTCESQIGVEVRSQVGWSEQGRVNSLIISDRLYNWR